MVPVAQLGDDVTTFKHHEDSIMLKTTRAATLFLWTAILLLPVASQAARPLGPPIEELVSGYNKVMAARAAERHISPLSL